MATTKKNTYKPKYAPYSLTSEGARTEKTRVKKTERKQNAAKNAAAHAAKKSVKSGLSTKSLRNEKITTNKDKVAKLTRAAQRRRESLSTQDLRYESLATRQPGWYPKKRDT